MTLVASAAVDWYAARAAGLVSYLLLSAVVVLGLALAGRERLPGWPRFALEEVHRFGGLLVGIFVSLHVLMIAADSQAHFSVVQLVVPFAAHYRPFWTGIGIVAAELLVALALANRYRKRISYRRWRKLHYVNFVVWVAATAHGLGSGTDRRSAWLLALYLTAVTAVGTLAVRRATRSPRSRTRGEVASAGSAAPATCCRRTRPRSPTCRSSASRASTSSTTSSCPARS